MSSPWKKVKGLFWQSGGVEPSNPEAQAGDPSATELSDAEFAALLEGSPHAVPKEVRTEPVDPGTVRVEASGDAIKIDFQQQYDLAGIPDTDEVEQLENFLSRLDGSLPHVSKLAAAQAFLGAIGKDKTAVLGDAERKIGRVRGILQAKEQETRAALEQQQQAINELQAQIDAHRTQMQETNRALEGVRLACLQEESRLQAARVFFGSVEPLPSGGSERKGK